MAPSDRHRYSELASDKDEELHSTPLRTTSSHRTSNLFAVAFIAGGALGGLAVALLHHFMNVFLNNKLVEQYKQQWVRAGGNAVAYVATTVMILSAGAALKQSVGDI